MIKNGKTLHDYDLIYLGNFINADGIGYDCMKTTDNVPVPFDISPKQFLKYAEYDLHHEYDHHLINSMSNSKRAIDAQITHLLYGLGLLNISKKKRKEWRFPTKIRVLNKVGVISPDILKKVNKRRNDLEHEFKNPNEEDVKDAYDIAYLFLNSTRKYLVDIPIDISICNNISEYDLSTKFDYVNGCISFYEPIYDETGNFIRYFIKEIRVDTNLENYLDYLTWYLKIYDLGDWKGTP